MGKDANPNRYTESDVRFLKAHVARLLATVVEQAQRIEELELRIARMQRDSSTSSKSPSSDITKPPKGGAGGGGGKKREPGGQQGHTKHERKLFKPDEIDSAWLYTFVDEEGLEPIAEDDPRRVVQQVEWTGRALRLIEHRARRYRRIDGGRSVTDLPPQLVPRTMLVQVCSLGGEEPDGAQRNQALQQAMPQEPAGGSPANCAA